MTTQHIYVSYCSGFFTAKSYAGLVRKDKSALNPENSFNCFVRVRIKGVDGFVDVDILNRQNWSYMSSDEERTYSALANGKCKGKHVTLALQYVFGRKFQVQFKRSRAACFGGYHIYA